MVTFRSDLTKLFNLSHHHTGLKSVLYQIYDRYTQIFHASQVSLISLSYKTKIKCHNTDTVPKAILNSIPAPIQLQYFHN